MLNLTVESMFQRHHVILDKGVTVLTPKDENAVLKLCIRGRDSFIVVNDIASTDFNDSSVYYITKRALERMESGSLSDLPTDKYILITEPYYAFGLKNIKFVKSLDEIVLSLPKKLIGGCL